MTPLEVRAYNAGVEAVLDIARLSAEAIARTSKRRVHEDFAIAALAQLSEAGKLLMLDEPARRGREVGDAGAP